MESVVIARAAPLSPTSRETPLAAVSWGAVLAGAAGAAALSLILFMLGSALGFASVSPWSFEGVSLTTLGVSAAIWLVVVQWAASALGGYLAGRLRTRWNDISKDEVFFRDTAHGFLAWAIATLFTAALLTSTIATIVSGGVKAATTVAAVGATGAGAAVAGTAAEKLDENGYYIDSLFRTATPVTANPDVNATPSAGGASGGAGAVKPEAGRIFAKALADGELAPADKTYLAQMIAANTGISQTEAEQRIDQVVAQAKAAEVKAKEAADKARKAASGFSLFIFLSLLIGAFIGSVSAALGGRLRDEPQNA